MSRAEVQVPFDSPPQGARCRQIYLGKHGSAEARKRYHEVMAAHLDGEEPAPRSPRRTAKQPASAFPTVTQLAAEFTDWAEREYLDASTDQVSREGSGTRAPKVREFGTIAGVEDAYWAQPESRPQNN